MEQLIGTLMFCGGVLGLFKVIDVLFPKEFEYSQPGHTCKLVWWKKGGAERVGFWQCPECRKILKSHTDRMDKCFNKNE
jgi:hypothetical protein